METATDLLTDEQKAALDADAIRTPICPNCKADPFIVAMKEFQIGNVRTLMFYCANVKCRKALNCQAVATQPQQQREVSRIHRA